MKHRFLPILLLTLALPGCSKTPGEPDASLAPRGTLVAQGPRGLFLIETDGSNLRTLRTGIDADDMAPQWSPLGNEIVYHARFFADKLQVVSLQGEKRDQNAGIPGVAEQVWAEYSPDASWIYFQAWSVAAANYQIWRIRPNGTGAARVSAINEVRSAEAPSPAPDGREVAYTLRFGAIPFEVVIQNLSTGQIRSLGAGFGVRWSPDGKWLAFVDGVELVVARADGSERKALNAAQPYRTGLDWSADSRWVVARRDVNPGSGAIDLIRIDGTQVVPIPNTESLRQPSLLTR